MSRSILLIFLLSVLIFFGAFANAGPADFNAAMKAGDYKSAAAETIKLWDAYAKSSAESATIAREFAFANYLAGDYDRAAGFMAHLVGPNAGLVSEDDQPEVSQVLAAAIQYGLKPERAQRTQLFNSLAMRMESEGAESVSIVASEALLFGDWSLGNFVNAKESAAMAVQLLARADIAMVERKRMAEMVAVISDFLSRRNRESYYRMADLHDRLVDDVDGGPQGLQRESLIQLKWMAHAWVKSIESFFSSDYSPLGSNKNRDIKPIKLKQSAFGNFYEKSYSADSRPRCEVELYSGRLRYPRSQLFRGTVGSVLLKIDFDENGRASNPSVLAAVPGEIFAESVLKAAPKFRLKLAKGQDKNACQMARTDKVVSINFLIR